MFGSKKPEGAPPGQGPVGAAGEPVIAAILLKDNTFPLERVRQELSESTIGGQTPAAVAIQKGFLMAQLGDETVAIAPMPAPYPWSDLEGPCATSWMWPKQTPATTHKSHRSHVLITLIGGQSKPVARRMNLMRLASIAARQEGVVGIYWAEATLVHYPPIFLKMAESADKHNAPPLYLWIDFRVLRHPEGGCAMFTTGMKALGQMEFEIPRIAMEPGKLREWAMNIAYYLLGGTKVKDGDTIGTTAEQRIRVRHRPSSFGHRGMVLQLQC